MEIRPCPVLRYHVSNIAPWGLKERGGGGGDRDSRGMHVVRIAPPRFDLLNSKFNSIYNCNSSSKSIPNSIQFLLVVSSLSRASEAMMREIATPQWQAGLQPASRPGTVHTVHTVPFNGEPEGPTSERKTIDIVVRHACIPAVLRYPSYGARGEYLHTYRDYIYIYMESCRDRTGKPGKWNGCHFLSFLFLLPVTKYVLM